MVSSRCLTEVLADLNSLICDKSRRGLCRFPPLQGPVHTHLVQWLIKVHCVTAAAQQGL